MPSESEAKGHPRDGVMGVVGRFECFCGRGRRGVLKIQFAGEMSEAILCECPDPFGDHEGRSGVDLHAEGHVGGALSARLNERVLACIGNEYGRPGGEKRLDTPMDELFVSKEREPQTQDIKADSPSRQAPMGGLYGAAAGTGHAHLLSRGRLEVKEEDVQPESKPVHFWIVQPVPSTRAGRPTIVHAEVVVRRRGPQRARDRKVRARGHDCPGVGITIPFSRSIAWIYDKPRAQRETQNADDRSTGHDRASPW